MEDKQAELRQMAEKVLGVEVKTPSDFEMLIGQIYQRTGELLSLSTVKRFWGYVDKDNEGYRVRQSTLDILARFAGYQDWATFCRADLQGTDESGDMVQRHLFVKELAVGTHLELRWKPDRVITARYEGDDLFTIVESVHSKLHTGDTFHCSHMVEGMPLALWNLVRNGAPAGNYICGKVHGVMFAVKR